MAQVDLGERRHRHHDDLRLGRMAAEIWQTALSRLHRDGEPQTVEPTLTQFVRDASAYLPVTHEVTALERPPLLSVVGDERREQPMTVRILYSDLDGTMVGPGGCFVRAADRADHARADRRRSSRCTRRASRCRWSPAAPARSCRRPHASSAPTASSPRWARSSAGTTAAGRAC